jgi:hypothetical protein
MYSILLQREDIKQQGERQSIEIIELREQENKKTAQSMRPYLRILISERDLRADFDKCVPCFSFRGCLYSVP